MKKKATKPNPLKVFNDNKAAAYKKAGDAMKDFKKTLKKAQVGGPTLQGPLPEFASKYVDEWNTKYPSPGGRGFHPTGPYHQDELNKLRDPNYSFHHQASDQFYNQNKNLYKDANAYKAKYNESKPEMLAEISKRKKITESTPRLATRPAMPIQKKGGAIKSKKK